MIRLILKINVVKENEDVNEVTLVGIIFTTFVMILMSV